MFGEMKLRVVSLFKMAHNVMRLGGRFNAAKPLLYEVPIYLALNSNRSDKQKDKKKKSGGNKFL